MGKKHDFLGFNRDKWTLRESRKHRSDARDIVKEVTKTGINIFESKYGVRHSVLLTLEYFDPVAFNNLYILGQQSIWLKCGLKIISLQKIYTN